MYEHAEHLPVPIQSGIVEHCKTILREQACNQGEVTHVVIRPRSTCMRGCPLLDDNLRHSELYYSKLIRLVREHGGL